MTGRTTAAIVADLRRLPTIDLPDGRFISGYEAADRLTELDARPCPHVHTADEGTQYCTLNCQHDALRPPCPTCGGGAWFIEAGGQEMTPCPDCVDGKVSIEQLAATWQAVHNRALIWPYPADGAIDYLRAVRP